jgi:hypothetical protein
MATAHLPISSSFWQIYSRSKGSRLFLAFSLAFLGRKDDTERARTELLAAYPNISAELLLNQGWVFDREEVRKLFLDGFTAANVPFEYRSR